MSSQSLSPMQKVVKFGGRVQINHGYRGQKLTLQPPSRSGEKNPMFRRNVPASRFFSKRGSRCPGSQSQGANTPSFWLFGSWSNVETQSIPQFPGWCSGYALDYRPASVGSSPSTGLPKFFCTFCHLALPPTEVFCIIYCDGFDGSAGLVLWFWFDWFDWFD